MTAAAYMCLTLCFHGVTIVLMLRSRAVGLLCHNKLRRDVIIDSIWCTKKLSTGPAEERSDAGHIPPGHPCIAPFAISPAAALKAFVEYQKAACFNLHSGDLLSSYYRLEPAFLPFYLFQATISAEAIAVLGRKADKSNKRSPMVWTRMDEWKQLHRHLLLPRTEPCMQVYASYRLRRDLAEAAKPSPATLAAAEPLQPNVLQQQFCPDPVAGVAAQSGPVAKQAAKQAAGESSSSSSSSTRGSSQGGYSSSSGGGSDYSSQSSSSSGGGSDHGSQSSSSNSSSNNSSAAGSRQHSSSSRSSSSSGGSSSSSSSSGGSSSSSSGRPYMVPLDQPDMRQAIAWQLCHRQIMHSQIEAAVQHFKQHLAADDVRDLQVRLTVHSRSVRIAYLPAYHLHYIHGEKYTPSRADIVPAEYDACISGISGRVCAELHPSPMKSQAAAAAAVGGVGLGAMPLSGFALGFDPGLASMGGADAAFLAVLAGTAAGVLASRLPLIARNKHAAEQAEADRKFYKQYDQRETAYGAPPDDHTLWLWKDADWRKWEQDDRWAWSGPQRKQWAEQLFKEQAQREIDRITAARQQEKQSQQQQEDAERESKREQKFGRSRRFAHAHGGPEESGARMSHQVHGQHKRRRDFLGYYKALGINLEEAGATITAEYIKSHYKAAALKLHPDKHVHSDEAAQKRAAERFRRLQLAYETLRDNDKRRAYDRGQLVQ